MSSIIQSKRRPPNTINRAADFLGTTEESVYYTLKKPNGNFTLAARLFLTAEELESRALAARKLAEKFQCEV